MFSKLNLSSSEIRKQFIDYFKGKDHQFVCSSSVVPIDDPTLLFTNAGMNQFKPYFLGIQKPVSQRVVNFQKCIRVSGKHNDLEEVGEDDYHHTFFEMLGNWSFSDYYKDDAIKWAWELLTDVWGLDKKRIWVTIFQDDDESGDIWKKNTDIHSDRILKFGEKDNFWEMGATGPCGPCTEIHYYIGNDPETQSSKGVNTLPEYREIWNLVFIQYNRDENGKLSELPEKHVDTGAGFERLVAILNGKSSNYDTDLFMPIIAKIQDLCSKNYKYKKGVPHRVIADHVRMLAFSIADGAMPGNEGRAYVLRRVLRRAARFGRMLEMKDPFIYQLTDTVCQVMGEAFPEIKEKQKHIEKVIQSEEISFNDTLDRGLEVYGKITQGLTVENIISGEDAFKLYDTYGFPLDLTELMAREDGLSIDIDNYNDCMIKQKNRARNAGRFQYNKEEIKWTVVGDEKATDFIGYDNIEVQSNITKYHQNNQQCEIVLDKTPFYAESGGQVGDTGDLTADGFNFKVNDVQKAGEEYIHCGQITSGSMENLMKVEAKINVPHRNAIRRNHTATHLLHQALKDILGDHVQQAGSLVGEKLLRFDLTHYEQISSEQLSAIENLVNTIILQNVEVSTETKPYKQACKDGAVSLFGEKYGDVVRVVSVPGFSKELCGGTHVHRTGDIGGFKINSEIALAAGVRRITAVTGEAISELINRQVNLVRDIRNILKCSEEEVIDRLNSLLGDRRSLEKENIKLQQKHQTGQVNDLVGSAFEFWNIKIVIQKLDTTGNLKDMGDQFRKKFKMGGIALIGTIQNDKPMVMCAVTDDLTNRIQADKIVKKVGLLIGGGGGGKSHIATAGGNDIESLNDALEKGEKLIQSLIKDTDARK